MEREQLRGNLIKLLTAVGLVLMCGFVVYGIAAGLFTSQQKMEVFLRPAGLWAPLLFTALQAIQVVIPILPGGIGCLGGVLMFGPVRGFLYNYVGICLGSVAAFLLSKRYGQPFVRSVAGERTYEKYAGWLEKGNRFDTFFCTGDFLPGGAGRFSLLSGGADPHESEKVFSYYFSGKTGVHRPVQSGAAQHHGASGSPECLIYIEGMGRI